MNQNIHNTLSNLRGYFTKGSERTVKAKRNVIKMFLYKGGDILIGLVQLPLTINYVDSENYGIWVTLSSMVAWMSFFDIGINNGLKNKLTEAIAIKDYGLAQKYVSTTYAMLSLIFIPLMLILLTIVPLIDWCSILNLPQRYGQNLVVALCILVAYFCLNTIFSTINVVLTADQQPADASLRNLIQHVASLVIIWILTLTTRGNLINLCLALCLCPIVIILIFNFTLYKGKYSLIAPTFKTVDFKVAPNLMKLGIKFFIIQVAGVIQWQLTNFLIIRYFGAVSVTEYNIAYKYLSVLYMVWGIMLTPVWAATTDAMTKGEYTWIRHTIDKFLKAFVLFTACGFLMVVLSPWVYDIWIGNKVSIPIMLSTAVLIYNLTLMFGGVFVNILNGCGILKLQMYSCLISPFIYLSTFFLCAKTFNIGIYSVVVAAIIANFNGILLAPIQCRHLLKKLPNSFS